MPRQTVTPKQNHAGVHVWLILMKAFQAIMPHAQESIARTGLGDSDFRVLEALLHKGPLPVNTIGPKVWLTPGSISIAVDRLVRKGLVVRKEQPADRRVRRVELTRKGRALDRCHVPATRRSNEECRQRSFKERANNIAAPLKEIRQARRENRRGLKRHVRSVAFHLATDVPARFSE